MVGRNRKKRSAEDMVLDSSIGVILILLCVATLYPFWYVVVVSLSSPAGIAKSGGFMLWPQGFNLDAYKAVIASSDIWIGFRNSIIYVVAGTTLSVVLTVLLAYPLSKSQLWGRKPLMLLISVTMFFSGGLMPSYILISKILDIDGTMLVMILPGAISTYNMLMMRTYFQGLPKELEESAQIDGASSMKVLIKIILPLSLPSVAVIALFYAVGLWNAWFSANLYLSQQRDLWPLALYMREVLVQGNVNSVQSQMSGAAGGAGAVQIAKSLKMATTVVSTVPILVVYPFVQRYFTQGVVMGAIKE
ncbi:carbohydrate ABC transporter permease [Lachnotalea sp. AF33-28]|uniref:carbohydrate ABC transporter permease n=1 Tax=Lachnotalea sp. AF33-28 TaxID=2292046 RepID=UPI0018F4AA96|nr:carbohydrate ABC transporter permease [Lachnotalea sp. AF33-28]